MVEYFPALHSYRIGYDKKWKRDVMCQKLRALHSQHWRHRKSFLVCLLAWLVYVCWSRFPVTMCITHKSIKCAWLTSPSSCSYVCMYDIYLPFLQQLSSIALAPQIYKHIHTMVVNNFFFLLTHKCTNTHAQVWQAIVQLKCPFYPFFTQRCTLIIMVSFSKKKKSFFDKIS